MTTDHARRVAELTPEQRRLLLGRLKQRKQEAGPDHPGTGPADHRKIRRRTDPLAPAPLSFAQERLWFLDRLDPGSPAYNIAFSVRITGPLDRAVLVRALHAVVSRHEALRTAFIEVDDRPHQVVRGPAEIPVPFHDLRDVSDANRPQAIRELTDAVVASRFDLTEGSPLATQLLALADGEHLLTVAVHHIVFDGSSVAVLVDDLIAHYDALSSGAEPTVPAPALQFADWASWERDHLAGRRFDEQLDYWRQRLDSAPALSTFPADRQRPRVQTRTGAYRPFGLTGQLTDGLVALAGGEGATLNAAVLAGVAALVHRATGQRDVLLGVSAAGRTRVEAESMIGSFADTFVLRVDLSGNPTLRELLRRTRDEFREAFRHQDVPYSKVVEAVAPARTPSHNPLFQIMLSIADMPEDPRKAGAVSFAVEQLGAELNSQLTDFDFYFALSRQPDGLRGHVGHNTDLFLDGTADGLLSGLRAVLTEMVAEPDRTLDRSESLRRRTVSVAATFTADPVCESLGLWSRLLGTPTTIALAPYGQVVQHLVADDDAEATAVLLRWEDWLRHGTVATPDVALPVLERAVDDLMGALGALRSRSGRLVVIGVTPPSAAFTRQPWSGLFAQLEDRLTSRARRHGNVVVVPAAAWSSRYPTAAVGDEQADALGHVPYVPEFFAALGTYLARELHRNRVRPVRTLLLDPARVLAHAEPGSGPSRALGRTLAEQQRLGRRIAFCGPRQLPGVSAHTTAGPVDPVDRMTELVSELGIDPADCLVLEPDAAVAGRIRTAFPTAHVAPVPQDPSSLPGYLDHLWALDAPGEPSGSESLDAGRLAHFAAYLTDPVEIAERAQPTATAVVPGDLPHVAPRTDAEERIAALWSTVLKLDEVGVTTDFFALGGHSLLATRLLSLVHREFGRHVPLSEFLTRPTVEQLAERVANAGEADHITPVPRGGVLQPSATQQRLWAQAQLGDQSARHNITFAAALHGPLDRLALRHAVEEILRRHEVLRTSFANHDSRPRVIVHQETDCWLPDRTVTAGEVADQVRLHALEDYDLEHGPLVRARLLRCSESEHCLLIGTHHIVSDAWSWGIFLRELTLLYAAFREGAQSPLVPLPIQFADYAVWQRGRLDRADAERQIGYWRELLADAPALLGMPTDRPRPAVRSDRSAQHTHLFGPELGDELRALSSAERTSLFSVLLAGFAVLLHRHSQDEDLVLGTPVAGRVHPELEDLIGYFADILPLRFDLSGEPTFRELIHRVHARVLEAHQHQEVPFSRIVEAVSPGRDPAFHPVFQSMFNFLDQPEFQPELAGLDVELLEVPAAGTDFDLFLTLSWHGERLQATLDYSAALFDPDTADRLLRSLEALLDAARKAPDTLIGKLDLGAAHAVSPYRPACSEIAAANAQPEFLGPPIAIAATFTAEPVRETIEHWLRVAGSPARVDFAPYAQVLQQLLAPDATLGAEPEGLNVVLLRWEDWLRYQGAELTEVRAASRLDQHLHELSAALRGFRERCDASLVIGVCPPSARYSGARWSRLFEGLTERLERFAAALDDVRTVSTVGWARQYGVSEVGDERADALGHMPYTADYYAVLGTMIARQAHCRVRPPLRTLVLDPALILPDSLSGPATAGQRELLRLLRGQLRHGRRLALLAAEGTAGPDPVGGRLPLDAAEVALRSTGPDLLGQFTELAEAGRLDPAQCLVLERDPEICAAVRARFPMTPVVALPDAAPRLRAVLSHVWYLDPQVEPIRRVPRPAAVVEELLTPTDARAVLAAAKPVSGATAGVPYRGPRTEHERVLTQLWADLLHVERVGIDDDFFRLGGDSLLSIQAVSLAAKAGITLTPRQLIQHPTVAALAEAAADGRDTVVRGPDDGENPLTPAHRWFLSTVAARIPNPAHFNHPYYLELLEPTEPGVLARALDLLMAHHDGLRSRFLPDGAGGWRQERVRPEPVPFASHDLSDLAEDERARCMVELAHEAQGSFDLAAGPLLRAVHFRLGSQAPDRLLIIPHHLLVDGMSRGILLEDLQSLCRQLAAGAEPTLPPKTTSLQYWGRRLEEYARSAEVRAELPFWLAQTFDDDCADLPVDFPDGKPTCVSYDTLIGHLEPAETTAVREGARKLGMKLGELLIGVVSGWLVDRTGRKDCTIALAGHGREDLFAEVDLSRTVGWFQVYYPMRLRDPGAGLASVRDQLAQVRNNGIGYSLLRYCSGDSAASEALAAVRPPVVSVNFMGDFSFAGTPIGTEMFGVPPAEYGSPQDENGQWLYLLDVVPSIVDRRLTLEINYSNNVHRRRTAEGIMRELLGRLRAIAAAAGE